MSSVRIEKKMAERNSAEICDICNDLIKPGSYLHVINEDCEEAECDGQHAADICYYCADAISDAASLLRF